MIDIWDWDSFWSDWLSSIFVCIYDVHQTVFLLCANFETLLGVDDVAQIIRGLLCLQFRPVSALTSKPS